MKFDGDRVIARAPDYFGGHTATTSLPLGHKGPVSMACQDHALHERAIATFTSFDQALKAACYAISPDGGYSGVSLVDGAGQQITHQDWQEWAF